MGRTADLRTIQDALSVIVRAQHSGRARGRIERRSGIPLAPTTIGVLSAIDTLGPVRHRAVAARVGIQPSRVSREVATLVAAGLVDEAPDPGDRRAVLLSSTDKGTDALQRYVAAAAGALAEVLAEWTDDELARFAPSLARLATAFRTDLADGDGA